MRRPEAGCGSASATGDEGDDDIGGVAVEVLVSPVVDGRGAGVGVTGGDLNVAQRHPGVEGRHDERGSEHVRVNGTEAGALRDRPDPPVGGAPVEALAVSAAQDRSFAAFADGEVDCPGCPGDVRDDGRLVAFAEDPQRPVAPIEAKVLDVGGACFADRRPLSQSSTASAA